MKKQYDDVYKEYQSKVAVLSKLQQDKSELVNKKGSLEQLAQLSTKIIQIENEINSLKEQYGAQLKEFKQLNENNNSLLTTQSNLTQKIQEHKKTTNECDSLFGKVESILARYSNFLGQRIDTNQIVIKQAPGHELAKFNLDKVMQEQNAAAFDEVLAKLNNLNATDSNGMTMLMHCLNNGFWYGVKKLLRLGADVDIVDNNDCNALIYACTMLRMKYIKAIAEKTSNINLKAAATNGQTALHLAIAQANSFAFCSEIKVDKILKICQFLISKRADINAQDNNGLTPLALSCSLKAKGLCVLLLEQPDIDLTVVDNSGSNVLSWALELRDKTILDKILNKAIPIDRVDNSGKTCLFWSVQHGWADMVEFLAQRGANVNIPNNEGVTPLYLAILKGDVPLVTKLLELNADSNIARTNGFFPIHGAAHVGSIEIIEKLIANGVDIDKKSASGHTALNYYCGLPDSKPEFAEFLIKKGANVDTQNSTNITPFYSACMAGNVEMVKFLYAAGANINLLNINGFHPIHGAIHYGKIAVVDELVKMGVSIDTITDNNNGYTPLQHYCKLATAEISVVEFLLAKGASISCSMNGKGLLHSAVMGKNIPIVKLLIAKGSSVNDLDQNGKTPLMLLLEDPNISKAYKLEIFEQYSNKVDKTVKNKEGKNILDYLETYCSEAIKFFKVDNTNTSVALLQSSIDNVVISHDMENGSALGLSGDQH